MDPRDINIFATWKARIVYLFVVLGIGAWLSLLEGFPLALCLVVSLAVGIVHLVGASEARTASASLASPAECRPRPVRSPTSPSRRRSAACGGRRDSRKNGWPTHQGLRMERWRASSCGRRV